MNMKRIAIFSTTIVAIVLSSCSDFLDVNTDPNNAQSSTPTLSLPAGITSAAARLNTNFNIMGGMWVQYWAQNNGSNQYKSYDSYNIQQSTNNSDFNELYSGSLQDLQYARDKSKSAGDWNLYLMSTVMQAYVYQMLADIYDEIPFDEALQGNVIPHPHFRPGQQVYDSLIQRIDFALSRDFEVSTNTNPGPADLIFNGNVDSWRRFANTLKLKIYMRQILARPDVAKAGIQAMAAANAQFIETDVAVNQFVDLENKSNPLYEADRRKLNTAENIKASRTFLTYLQSTEDTFRIRKLFTKPPAGYKGIEQGNFGVSTVTLAPATVSGAVVKPTDPVYFMTVAERYFFQAEAVARNIVVGDAQALYQAGIDAAFARMGGVGAPYYATGKPYAYPNGTEDENLHAIARQKWIALAGINGLEAFFERNRLEYPEYNTGGYDAPSYEPGQLVYPIGSVLNVGIYPMRLLFPETERNRNPNTPEQIDATVEVWWDR
jgi:hypothetical protein